MVEAPIADARAEVTERILKATTTGECRRIVDNNILVPVMLAKLEQMKNVVEFDENRTS